MTTNIKTSKSYSDIISSLTFSEYDFNFNLNSISNFNIPYKSNEHKFSDHGMKTCLRCNKKVIYLTRKDWCIYCVERMRLKGEV